MLKYIYGRETDANNLTNPEAQALIKHKDEILDGARKGRIEERIARSGEEIPEPEIDKTKPSAYKDNM